MTASAHRAGVSHQSSNCHAACSWQRSVWGSKSLHANELHVHTSWASAHTTALLSTLVAVQEWGTCRQLRQHERRRWHPHALRRMLTSRLRAAGSRVRTCSKQCPLRNPLGTLLNITLRCRLCPSLVQGRGAGRAHAAQAVRVVGAGRHAQPEARLQAGAAGLGGLHVAERERALVQLDAAGRLRCQVRVAGRRACALEVYPVGGAVLFVLIDASAPQLGMLPTSHAQAVQLLFSASCIRPFVMASSTMARSVTAQAACARQRMGGKAIDKASDMAEGAGSSMTCTLCILSSSWEGQ